VKVVGVGVVILSEIAVGLNTYRKPDAHFLEVPYSLTGSYYSDRKTKFCIKRRRKLM
jgi:hypothetical protein